MLHERSSRVWQRLTISALVISALPLLFLWSGWSSPSAAPRSLEGWPAPPSPGWESKDEIVVGVHDDARPADIARLAQRMGLQLFENSAVSAPGHLMRARVLPGTADAVLARLRRDRLVEAAEPLRY